MFNEPEGGNGGALALAVEDVSCTEAWIKLGASGTELPASVKLYANDTLKQTLELTTLDTLIYDEGLLPNRAYAYRAELIKPQKPTVKSQTVTARTLDTTSHDFTWETFTFGGANGSSYLRDVAIINENDIWAVGEIHTSWTDQWDSNGVWVQPYNAVHWNGQEWELKRIYFPTVCGQQHLTSYPASAIFEFNDGQIWISSSGDKIAVIENNEQINRFCLPSSVSMSINAIWGASSSDLYIVGNEGKIAHYDGSGWEKIESGTESDLTDVYGVGENIFAVSEKEILQINSNEVINRISIPEGTVGEKKAKSVWLNTINKIYFADYSVYVKNGSNWSLENLPAVNRECIRGKGLNEILTVREDGVVEYFNGVGWYSYEFNYNNWFWSVSIKENTYAIAGLISGEGLFLKGVVVIGHKN